MSKRNNHPFNMNRRMDKYAKGDKVILGIYVKHSTIHQEQEKCLKVYVKDDKIHEEKETSVKVYRCRSKEIGALFFFLALKKTRDLKPSEKEGIPLTTLKEIEFRRRLRHRNVIRLIDMKEDVDKHKRPVQYLVYEYMESDLNKYMDFQLNELNIDIPPMMIHKLMYQLLSGLAYCHKKQAMHSSISTLVSPPTS